MELKEALANSNVKFVISTWLSNKYRTNDYIFGIWKNCFVATKEHFYHIGGKEVNRIAIYEALLSNIKLKDSIPNEELLKRIENNQSRLTTEIKEKIIPIRQELFDKKTSDIVYKQWQA